MESKVITKESHDDFEDMTMDDVAALLVKFYADHVHDHDGQHSDNYAKAIGIAIRMLSD